MEIIQTVQPRAFQLRPAFLESYYAKGDPFRTLLARSTYLNKYSRTHGKVGEVWTDTIKRVIEGSMALDPRATEMEGEMLFHLFWTGQVLPPGRGLWTGGIPGIPADARFNCFAPETRFWANGTLVSFEEAAGQTVEVLTKDGQWRPAEVRSFGKQKLYRYLLKPPGRTNFAFEYVATAEHRWFTSNRGEVTDLRVGDRVSITPHTVDDACPAYIDGFAHGFVFGDGSKDALKQDIYRLRLCGEKDQQHAPKLKSASTFHNDCTPPSFKGDPLIFFKSPRNLKLLPSDDLGRDYLAGFLAGWLAADGSLRSDGRGGNRLAAQNAEALDWVVERAPLLGFCVTGRSFDPSTETNFGSRSSRLEILTLQDDPVEYTVREVVDEGREEEVFCVTEPITGSFTLSGGVVTGNCWYTTLRGIEDWCWTMERLMLGGGVGVGLSEIHQLPGVSETPCKLSVHCRADHPDVGDVKPNDKAFLNGSTPIYHAEDSREGWVEAARRVFRAAFEGRDLIVDVSDVRQRGSAIKTFGGVACGPGPLVHLLRSAFEIIRAAAGRKLTSVECLDITNFIGFCVKSGNVRRSALITLGDANDREFRDAKKDWEKVASHRHTSNNSIVFRSWGQIENFDWQGLVNDMTENGMGEPGLLNLPLVWRTDPLATGVNPCFTGDTRIATQFGLVPIKELASWDKNLRVTTDNRVLAGYQVDTETVGTTVRDAVPAFQTADAAEIYRVTTAKGYSLQVTKYHKFPTPDGVLELQNLSVGDTLLLQSGEGQWGTAGSFNLGAVIGWVEGDGNFNGDDKVTLRFWGEQKPLADIFLPWCAALADAIPAANGRPYNLSVVPVPERDLCEITSMRLCAALAEVGYRAKGAVPEVVWRGSRECAQGYLQGLFGADGQINWAKDKQSFSIRLSQSNPGLLHDVQALLANFGIVSAVYKRRNAGWRRMPDGKGGMKNYWCEDQFDLCISKQNAVRFAEQVGFLLESHAALYTAWRASWVRGPYAESFTDDIVSIELVGVEPTYCTTQPSHHTLIAEGVVTGNCGEQAMHDREACNLAEVFPAQFEDGTDIHTALKLTVRYCLRQRLTPLLDAKSHEVGTKNMRVGVGLGGLCDFAWTPYQLGDWWRTCRQEANDYADFLGVNRPLTTTTIKPSGTISLLNGSSPGIHAPWDEYIIRRIRVAVNDPMAYALADAGVPFEYDIYDQTEKTLVFAFPHKARFARSTVQSQTVREQFERQALVQEWWADNAVSATISFKEDEKEQLPHLLREFVPRLKSTTCLPAAHGYRQAPLESIDEETYNRLHAQINHSHPLVRGGDFEVEECAGGVCPIR